MTKMKAVGLLKSSSHDDRQLRDLEVDKPKPGAYDLLVKVKAIGVNPVDFKVRNSANLEKDEPKILGWDVAGIVEEVGANCTLFNVGDEVYYAGDVTRPGANSQFHVVHEDIVGRKPKNLSFTQAAALPLTTLTAYESLFHRLGISLDPEDNLGQSILIIGASGGVGSIATQLASYAGLQVIGTASRTETIDWTKNHGSAFTINHHEAFASQLMEKGIKVVDYILCLHATDDHFESMARVIAPEGKICSIVETKDPVRLGLLKDKSATFVWEFMFTRSKYKTKDMIKQHEILNEVALLMEDEKLKTTLNTTLSPINAKNLQKAHEMLESGETIGKIVVENFE